ncbi:hypothetical protein B1M_22612, partial [Burkholderia sp. TJI49]
ERRHGILDLSQFRGASASVAAPPRSPVRAAVAKSRDDMQLSLF